LGSEIILKEIAAESVKIDQLFLTTIPTLSQLW
jgi:hypothetical protein